MLFPANLLFFKDAAFISVFIYFHFFPPFFITGITAMGLNISKIFLYNLQPTELKLVKPVKKLKVKLLKYFSKSSLAFCRMFALFLVLSCVPCKIVLMDLPRSPLPFS